MFDYSKNRLLIDLAWVEVLETPMLETDMDLWDFSLIWSARCRVSWKSIGLTKDLLCKT